jgi:hypothetical protein
MIITAKETMVGGFLFLSGVLLTLVGLGAMIEGNLHCFSILRGKKAGYSHRVKPRSAI